MAESDIPGFEEIRAAAEGNGPIPHTCRDAGTFVHLHVHTEYSLLDGATRLKDLCTRAKELGMPAVAITDHGYMYGCAEFYQEAINAGIKPIIGCEIYFTPDSTLSREGKGRELYHMVLLAKNNQGYRNLMRIVSDAATEGFYYKPRVTYEALKKYHEGILATSACIAGVIPKSIDRGEYEVAKDWAQKFIDIFGKDDFYIELQNQGPEVITDNGISQPRLNDALCKLAAEMGLKTVGTNDLHYLRKEDAYTQDLMLCISMGKFVSDKDRMKFPNDQFYLKSPEEMAEALREHPECLETTLEIADKCNVTLEFGNIILPRYPFLKEGETNESLLWEMTLAGLKRRYGDPLSDEVMERFEHEYKIICEKGFAAYFLIVQEFSRWAKENGIGVGPGRGSAAGSIISYALDITSFDPLANDLIFERFLSPERTEMPDIDMDFDDERRLDVIQHCRDIYGPERIAHVITYSKMKAKQAVNDAARVLEYPIYMASALSKMIPNDPKATLDKAIAGNPDLKKQYETDPDSAKIIDAAKKLEGLTRGEGVHASAVIICRDPVYDYVPTKLDTKGGMIITQYDGVMTANMGLLKMDFLGLRTLTVISKALANIKANHGVDIDVEAIDMKDPLMYELFAKGQTAGVFQVESAGMRALLKRMRPDCYDDIVAVIALYRPGPLGAGMVDDFVDRKLGRKEVTYPDPRLKPVLESTYGTIVYQEQVMRISVLMSGFTVGESDKVRKAVAKKKVNLMKEVVQKWADGTEETMEDHWINGAERNGYSREMATDLWEKVLEFAEYAFNKSHSAAYGILTMQTAWLKSHYPNEYMAAVLSSYMGKTDKIVHYVNACRGDGIAVLPPDINVSHGDFTATADGVRFGLAGLKGVGEKVAELIIKEREENGPFTSLHDYAYRVPTEAYNKRVLEALVKAGAFDSTGYTRKQLYGFVVEGTLIEQAQQRQLDRTTGQGNLFDMFADEGEDLGYDEQNDIPAPNGDEWPRLEKLRYEKEVIGIYVSDHPLSSYVDALEQNATAGLGSLDDEDVFHDGRTYDFAGMVANVQVKPTKKGTNMAIVTLEDMEASVDVLFWSSKWEEYRELLQSEDTTGQIPVIHVRGKFERSDRGDQIVAFEVDDLTAAGLADDGSGKPVRRGPSAMAIHVRSDKFSNDVMGKLSAIFDNYPGANPVTLFIEQADGRKFRAELPVSVNCSSKEMVDRVGELVGSGAIELK